jgi:Na+-transporting NADH:ubiquinone oxidoreductase subunit C
MNVESTPRALAVAAVFAVACSAMVATAVQLLRPLQHGFAELERNRAILEAAGTLPESASERQLLDAYRDLDAEVIDLATGRAVPHADAYDFDHWATGADDAGPASEGAAARPARVPVYRVLSGGELRRLVLPVDGPGMWSRIYGYLALEPDLSTIADLVIFRHGETPGIGDRIQRPEWREQWRGKRLYDDEGRLVFRVVQDATGPHEVDLISGASVTSEAVGTMVHSWFGAGGYGPLLDRLATTGEAP